jgi:hypothetical protein
MQRDVQRSRAANGDRATGETCGRGVLQTLLYGGRTTVGSKSLITVLRSRRLEDHIRTLSEKLAKAQGEEFHQLAIELRTAISDHIGTYQGKIATAVNNRGHADWRKSFTLRTTQNR